MSEDIDKLHRMLERATAAEDAPVGDMDPETASLREAWLSFGQLLEAAHPPAGAAVQLPHQLDSLFPLPLGEGQIHDSPLPLGEGPGVRAMPRRTPARRWFLSATALMAASLLIGFLTTWAPRGMDQSQNPLPTEPQTAAIKVDDRALVQQKQPATVADELRWDDTLDDEIDQVGQQMLYVQQRPGDTVAMLEYGIEQMQQELDENRL